MQLVCPHFKCLQGPHPFGFQKLQASLSNEFSLHLPECLRLKDEVCSSCNSCDLRGMRISQHVQPTMLFTALVVCYHGFCPVCVVAKCYIIICVSSRSFSTTHMCTRGGGGFSMVRKLSGKILLTQLRHNFPHHF